MALISKLNMIGKSDSSKFQVSSSKFQVLLAPLEEVVESKHEDEVEVLQVLLGLTSQLRSSVGDSKLVLEEQVSQLEQKVQHELQLAKQRHDTHLEVFKQVHCLNIFNINI